MASVLSSPSVLSARRVRSHSGGASARVSSARLKAKSGFDDIAPNSSRGKGDGGPPPPSYGALLQRHNAQLRDAVECNRLMLTVIEQFKQVPNSPLHPTYGLPLDSDVTTPAKQEKQALERQLKQLRERLAQHDLRLPTGSIAAGIGPIADDRGKSPFGGSSISSDYSRRETRGVDMGTQTDPPPTPRRHTPATLVCAPSPPAAPPPPADPEGPKPPSSPSTAVILAKKRIALRRLENSTPERGRKIATERSAPTFGTHSHPPPEEPRQDLQHWIQQATGLKELTAVLQGQCEAATSQWLALQETTRKIARDVQLAIQGLKEELTCPICLDVFSGDTVTLQSCGHSLCRPCLVSLKAADCPSCRTPFYSSCPSATHKSSCVIHTCVKSLKDLENALQPMLGEDGFEERPA
jgi:hypothetical protein